MIFRCFRRPDVNTGAGERGQATVLFALMLVGLLGVAGLVIDGSNTQENHRQMQNAADAAALAGAEDLPAVNTTTANADAAQWLTKNASSLAEASIAFSQTSSPNDTIAVTITRTVPFSFSKALKISPSAIIASASAKANGSPANHLDLSQVNGNPAKGIVGNDSNLCYGFNVCPYAVWAFHNDPGETKHIVGDIVTFQSTQWKSANVKSGSSYWSGNSNNFKGFLRPLGTALDVGNTLTAGGVACGQQPIAQIQAAYNARQPIVLPVYDGESGNGHITLHVAGFVMLNINFAGNPLPNCPADMQGKIMTFMASATDILTYNSADPTSWVYNCPNPSTSLGICRNYPVLTK